MSRMFSFITKTWNPLGGECKNNCSYCWAKKLIERYNMKKYEGPAKLYRKELTKKFRKDDFVFVQDMSDLFGQWVPTWIINEVIKFMRDSPATFLLLTKNPRRYIEDSGLEKLSKNVVCGATIETDFFNEDKLTFMDVLGHPRKMVSVEPIMNFNLVKFSMYLAAIKPEFVAIGYDNYNNGLNEPKLEETKRLIYLLEEVGIKVYRKTLREPIPQIALAK